MENEQKSSANNEINTAATAEEPQQQTIQETEPSQSESVPSQDAQDGADQQIDVSPKFVPSDATYDWKDITQEFFEAVKELSLGELVHHKMFGLFEAMSAIEMMDPKMDAGMCCNKNTSTPLTFDTAVITNKLKLVDFNPNEMIGIMDGIYSCLVSWLEGHSLSQTLFTCLYLHQPYRIEDKTLKAFCIAMHKLAQIIRKFITHAQVFEEEDFEIRDYEYNLMPDTTNVRACYMLKECEDECMKKIRSVPTNGTNGTEDLQAIVNRLRFLRHLLQSLIAIWPDKKVSATETEMGEIQKLLNGALDAMPIIKKTIAKGTQPEPNSDAPNPMGFSPMVNQRILPPTFPRYTKIKDRMLSMNFLEELVQRIKIACKVIFCNNYHSALNFFMDFSRKSGPCLLSRSVLQFVYFPNPGIRFGTTPLVDVLRESVKAFVAPPVLMPRHPLAMNPQAIECVDAFFTYCNNIYSFVTFIQICGYNKARQRDKLAHLLDDFANLEDEAERVDAFLHSLTSTNKEPQPYFSTWILYHSLRAMSMYLLSGLELELYSLHEYIYIFWYLSQFLSNWIVTTLSRAECLSKQMLSATAKDKKKPKANKKKQNNMYYREIVLNQALFSMFTGYFKAVAGFTQEKRIPQPLPMFDDEKVRFEHRFAPFAGLTTLPPVTYGEFNNMRLLLFLKHQPTDLFSNAAINFKKARCILEAMLVNPDTEIQDIIRVAKTNYVVMNLLATGHKKDSTAPPEFDFSIHRYFPIIKP